jgi:hypothetical protein
MESVENQQAPWFNTKEYILWRVSNDVVVGQVVWNVVGLCQIVNVLRTMLQPRHNTTSATSIEHEQHTKTLKLFPF